MKLQADMGISRSTVEELGRLGHDVVHVRDEGLEGLPDSDILAKARRESRVILTFGLDFGDLLAAGLRKSPSVVTLRLHDGSPSSVTRRLIEVLRGQEAALVQFAIITVEDSRYRVRRLPMGASDANV
jgi:predicted nuclease of predicted toxin-antitoxin system